MKIPSALSKGLDEDQMKRLEAELKGALLVKILRRELGSRIEQSYKAEETVDSDSFGVYLKGVGERRGYRQILNLLPEE